MAFPALDHDGSHIVLGMPGPQQDQGQHHDPMAALVHQSIEDDAGRWLGHLQEADIHHHLRKLRGHERGDGPHLRLAVHTLGTVTDQEQPFVTVHVGSSFSVVPACRSAEVSS